MQPWQSVLLILITLIVFGAGFYYDQIKKNTAIAYEDSLIKSQKPIVNKQESNTSNELQSSIILKKSSAWAETNILIKISQSNSHHTYLHKEELMYRIKLQLLSQLLLFLCSTISLHANEHGGINVVVLLLDKLQCFSPPP